MTGTHRHCGRIERHYYITKMVVYSYVYLNFGEVHLLIAIMLRFLMENLVMNRIMAGDNNQVVENLAMKDMVMREKLSKETSTRSLGVTPKTLKSTNNTEEGRLAN
jgi:hypothetical protein